MGGRGAGALPDLPAMRRYRLARIVAMLEARDLAGVLVFDPLNIRYATDSTSMQLWNTHNPFRACLVTADGYMVLWDYKNSPFLADHNPLVRETRSGASMFYFTNGDKGAEAARGLPGRSSISCRTHVGGNRRLAVDKILLHGARALEAVGFELSRGRRGDGEGALDQGTRMRFWRCAARAMHVRPRFTRWKSLRARGRAMG